METPYEYDVCLSFAGEDRPYVHTVAQSLMTAGVRVFYDESATAQMWGKDLIAYLDAVYRLKARFCIVFISRHYAAKLWPRHELRSAQARAFIENREYILPVRLDETDIGGILPTVGYVNARRISAVDLAALIVQKLGCELPLPSDESASNMSRSVPAWDWGDWIPFAGEFISQNVVRADEMIAIASQHGTVLEDHGYGHAAVVHFHDAECFCQLVGGRLPSAEAIEYLTKHDPPLLRGEAIERGWCSFEWTRSKVDETTRLAIQATPGYKNKYKYFATVEADATDRGACIAFRVALLQPR